MNLIELTDRALYVYKAKQERVELAALLQVIDGRNFGTVLELGTADGGSLSIWAGLAASDATLIAVDDTINDYREHTFKLFLRDSQELYCIRHSSWTPGTYDTVVKILNGRPLDLLYIDAGHYYKDVHDDFHAYNGLVHPGGIIIMHDIGRSRGDCMQVPKFWNEIKDNYRYEEFMSSDLDNRCGLGILYVD